MSDQRRIKSPEAGEAVTPHDTNPLQGRTSQIWVGGTGDLAVVMAGGMSLTFTGVPAKTFIPVCATHVKATGTTATNIVALFE